MQSILFSFKPTLNITDSYAWALDLALRTRSALSAYCFWEGIDEGPARELAYVSILKARGHHLSHFGDPKRRNRAMRINRPLQMVTLPSGEHLAAHLASLVVAHFDMLVLPPQFVSSAYVEVLRSTGKPIFLLPEAFAVDSPDARTPHRALFFETLRASTLVHVPDRFYRQISHDPGLFNYLIALFGSKTRV